MSQFDPKIKILLVEDQKSHFMMLEGSLNDIGYDNITWKENGQDGFNEIVEKEIAGMGYDLVISDINMPIMNGLELLKKVRSHKKEEISQLCFMISSAVNEQDKIIDAVLAGASDYMIKPIDPEMMKEKLFKYFILNKNLNKAG